MNMKKIYTAGCPTGWQAGVRYLLPNEACTIFNIEFFDDPL